MNTLINAVTQAHASIKFEVVLEDWLICQSISTHYPRYDINLLAIAQILEAETGVGYHLIDMASLSFEFYSFGNLPEAEIERLCQEHQEAFQQEHDSYMASCGIYY